MSRQVAKVKETTTIEDAITLLHERRIGSLVITDSEGRCKGIYTERDALRNIAGKLPMNTPLGEAMTQNPFTLEEEASISEAKMIMVSHRIRHIPVVDRDGRPIGILTGRDLVEEIIGIPSVKI